MGEKHQTNLPGNARCQSLSLQAVFHDQIASVPLLGWDQLKARPEPGGQGLDLNGYTLKTLGKPWNSERP